MTERARTVHYAAKWYARVHCIITVLQYITLPAIVSHAHMQSSPGSNHITCANQWRQLDDNGALITVVNTLSSNCCGGSRRLCVVLSMPVLEQMS